MDRGFSFWFQLVGQRDFVHRHPATMEKLLRALLRAQSYLMQHPAEASAVVAAATRMTPELFTALWPNFQFQLALPQGMLNLLEDQARWAIDNHYTPATQAPNFLDVLYLDGLLAVQPGSVSIVR